MNPLPGTFYSRNKERILLYEKTRHETLTDQRRENLRAYQALYYVLKKKPLLERMNIDKEVVIKKKQPKKEKSKKEVEISSPPIPPASQQAPPTKRAYKKKKDKVPVESYKYEKGLFTLSFD